MKFASSLGKTQMLAPLCARTGESGPADNPANFEKRRTAGDRTRPLPSVIDGRGFGSSFADDVLARRGRSSDCASECRVARGFYCCERKPKPLVINRRSRASLILRCRLGPPARETSRKSGQQMLCFPYLPCDIRPCGSERATNYSNLSAAMGSIFIARRAGM